MVAVATLAIAAALLAFTVLGSSDSKLSPIAQAAEKTNTYSGGRMTMEGSMTSATLSGPVQLSSDMAFDNAAGKVRGTFSINGPPPVGSLSGTEIVSGNKHYVSSPALPAPAGKTWMRIPSQATAGGDSGEPFSLADPTDQLAVLESVSGGVGVVGREQIRGDATTHYFANISFDKEAELLRAVGEGENADMVDEVADLSVTDGIPINVWIDTRGLVRRLTFTIVVDQGGGSGAINMSMDFFGFGSKPKIEVPPADQVYEGSPQMLDSLSS
jgi:hypothetical protein